MAAARGLLQDFPRLQEVGVDALCVLALSFLTGSKALPFLALPRQRVD